MKVQSIGSGLLRAAGRADAGFHLAPGQLTAARLELARTAGVPLRRLGDMARVWSPNRFKRAYAAPGEKAVPYLRPYDVFNYLSEPADFLSAGRTVRLENFLLRPGMILQTCSGRNLGPAVLVDEYLSRFALSHDMIRVEVGDERARYYTLAFLQSKAGQALLRRDKTGSVIDHLSDRHVAEQEVPFFPDIVPSVSDTMKAAVRLREEARLELSGLIGDLESQLSPAEPSSRRCDGWTVGSRHLSASGRVDAAFHDPLPARTRAELLALGGTPVGAVADVKLPGRFKRNYTLDPERGKPMVSSAQLLEETPTNLQYILPRSFRDAAEYEVRAGWVAYAAGGRAEEALGTPVLITSDRDGWFASNHVGRVVPRGGVSAGSLYLGLKTRQAQLQIKAMASGSVVDATYPRDMERVVIPPAGAANGERCWQVWEKFRTAHDRQCEAARAVDDALAAYATDEKSGVARAGKRRR